MDPSRELVLSLPPPALVTLPVVGRPERFPVRRVYCVGRNYAEHVAELGNAQPTQPVFFTKHRDAVVEGGEVAFPPKTSDYQHEVELVLALKAGGLRISRETALSCIFGYAVGLDMTRRDQQHRLKAAGLPWDTAKNFDQSAPCGPITPVETSGHLTTGRIQLDVNGISRQGADLADMIWGVADLVCALSEEVRLEAGDLIFTGTPSGVGAVSPGDVLVARVDGLASLEIRVGPPQSAEPSA